MLRRSIAGWSGNPGGASVTTARSSSPARILCVRSDERPGTIVHGRAPRSSISRRTAAGTSPAAIDGVAPTRNGASTVGLRRAATNARSASRTASCACARKARPATVGRTPFGTRSRSLRPASRSSPATWRDTADCVYPRCSAAAENDPSRQVSKNARHAEKFTDPVCALRIPMMRSTRLAHALEAERVVS